MNEQDWEKWMNEFQCERLNEIFISHLSCIMNEHQMPYAILIDAFTTALPLLLFI